MQQVFGNYSNAYIQNVTAANSWTAVTIPTQVNHGSGVPNVTALLSCVATSGTQSGSLFFAVPDVVTAPTASQFGVAIPGTSVVSIGVHRFLYVNSSVNTDIISIVWLW